MKTLGSAILLLFLAGCVSKNIRGDNFTLVPISAAKEGAPEVDFPEGFKILEPYREEWIDVPFGQIHIQIVDFIEEPCIPTSWVAIILNSERSRYTIEPNLLLQTMDDQIDFNVTSDGIRFFRESDSQVIYFLSFTSLSRATKMSNK